MTAPSLLLRYNERDDCWPPPLAAGITARSLVPTSLFTQSSAPVPLYLHFFFVYSRNCKKRTVVGFHVNSRRSSNPRCQRCFIAASPRTEQLTTYFAGCSLCKPVSVLSVSLAVGQKGLSVDFLHSWNSAGCTLSPSRSRRVSHEHIEPMTGAGGPGSPKLNNKNRFL